jgi:hypothetical protein
VRRHEAVLKKAHRILVERFDEDLLEGRVIRTSREQFEAPAGTIEDVIDDTPDDSASATWHECIIPMVRQDENSSRPYFYSNSAA